MVETSARVRVPVLFNGMKKLEYISSGFPMSERAKAVIRRTTPLLNSAVQDLTCTHSTAVISRMDSLERLCPVCMNT